MQKRLQKLLKVFVTVMPLVVPADYKTEQSPLADGETCKLLRCPYVKSVKSVKSVKVWYSRCKNSCPVNIKVFNRNSMSLQTVNTPE